MNKPDERLLEQRVRGLAQQGAGGAVGFQDQPRGADGEVAHRGLVVEVYIARPLGVQGRLGLAQFLVLQLQFNLMHAQFVEHLLGGRRRQGLKAGQCRGGLCLGSGFGLLAQLGGRRWRGVFGIHARIAFDLRDRFRVAVAPREGLPRTRAAILLA